MMRKNAAPPSLPALEQRHVRAQLRGRHRRRHALQAHQPFERDRVQRAQVQLTDPASGERLHRPRALEGGHADHRVEHRQRSHAIGHARHHVEPDRPADVVHHQVEALQLERVDGGHGPGRQE
jgi:hypothetical protein